MSDRAGTQSVAYNKKFRPKKQASKYTVGLFGWNDYTAVVEVMWMGVFLYCGWNQLK